MEMYPVRKIEGNDSDLILCFSFRLQHPLPHMPMYDAVAGNFPLSTFPLSSLFVTSKMSIFVRAIGLWGHTKYLPPTYHVFDHALQHTLGSQEQ